MKILKKVLYILLLTVLSVAMMFFLYAGWAVSTREPDPTLGAEPDFCNCISGRYEKYMDNWDKCQEIYRTIPKKELKKKAKACEPELEEERKKLVEEDKKRQKIIYEARKKGDRSKSYFPKAPSKWRYDSWEMWEKLDENKCLANGYIKDYIEKKHAKEKEITLVMLSIAAGIGLLIVIIMGSRSYRKAKFRRAGEAKIIAEEKQREVERIASEAKTGAGQEYNELVSSYLSKQKEAALNKLGIDEFEVKEIDPVHSYELHGDGYEITGKDGKTHNYNRYCTTQWIFFTATQVHVLASTFDFVTDKETDVTKEFFYKDITDLSTISGVVNITVSSGDRYSFEASSRSIQALKAKVREKKA